MNSNTLYILDIYGFLFRAYYALPPLANDGVPVGAIYGMTNMLIKLLHSESPNHIVAILDSGQNTFRNEIYPEYKANRDAPPEDLVPQFGLIDVCLSALGILGDKQLGYEADDLIASYTKNALAEGMNVRIISSDKDLMQLISGDGKVLMYDPMKDKLISAADVVEKFGVTPSQITDFLSILGDSSDNIPGIKGIGAKGAAELLQAYGSIEGIYENIDVITQKGKRQKLLEGKDSALLSRDLVLLRDSLDVTHSLPKLAYDGYDYDTLLAFLKEYKFTSIEKLISSKQQVGANGAMHNESPDVTDGEYGGTSIIDVTDISTLESALYDHGAAFIHIQSDAVYFNIHKVFYKFNLEDKALLHDIFFEDSKRFIFSDAKSIFAMLGLEYAPRAYEDICSLSYSLYSSSDFDLDRLINEYLGVSPEDNAIFYLADLYTRMLKLAVENEQYVLYANIERPIAGLLYDMEQDGIYMDVKKINKIDRELRERLNDVESEIFATTMERFNINSSKQLSQVLFESLSIPPRGKKLSSGYYSTNNEVLTALSEQGYDIADKILEYRHIAKLINTYTSVLPDMVSERDNRLHTTFLNHSTNTGRLSSISPNLQNIPTDCNIRSAFIAQSDDTVIISADYSQIELRLLAHIADIKTMQRDLWNGIDLHASTASGIFGVDVADVTNQMRRSAKAINFGIIYGISSYGLAKRLGIPKAQAAEYISLYFEKYNGIQEYMNAQVEFARQNGYVKTIFGRRCVIKGINSKNYTERGFAERAAINASLQGSAADIVKRAMVKLPREIKEVLQIHDELLFEVPKDKVTSYSKVIQKTMSEIIKLKVPLSVDIKVGWEK